MAKKKTVTKKKKVKQVEMGKIYISASFNNTLITITDQEGQTVTWGSAGKSGFKGTRKATPFAATTAVEEVVTHAVEESGLEKAEVYVNGPGPGRDAALRAVKSAGVSITMIADVTPMPHNGPRPKKRRRV